MSDSKTTIETSKTVDYTFAFRHMPVAQMISRDRIIIDCSHAFADMFETTCDMLVGQTVKVLYPTEVDFEKFGKKVMPVLAKHGHFTDSRAMKRLTGGLFWVNVSGFSAHRNDPYAEALWVFSEIRGDAAPVSKSASAQVVNSAARSSMTPRERDVAALLIQRQTAKEIGKTLGISPRTVEIYRTRLLRKFNVTHTQALIKSLLS
jgi:DNA-binding CsgD family transcriptional regulator